MKKQFNGKSTLRGFSLIELMVAILVGIILLGGMVQIFIMSRTSYRIQTNLNYMQENLRFAANQLSYSVRMAGYFHTIPDGSSGVIRVDASMPAPSCGIASWVNGIRGFEGDSTLPPGATCLNVANYLPNTDVLVVTYAQPTFVYPGAVETAIGVTSAEPVVPAKPYVMIYDKQYFPRGIVEKGVLGSGTEISILAALPGSLLSNDNTSDGLDYARVNRSRLLRGAGMFPMAIDLYYIRRCSRMAGATCANSDDGGEPQPTLVKASLDATGALVQEPIVESIEQMQIEYLASGCPDFIGASQLTVANWGAAGCTGTAPANVWSRVIDVRIRLLARSNVTENGYVDTTPYNLSSDTNAYLPSSAASLPQNVTYRRKLMTITALPRNAVRPLPQ